MHIDEAMTVLSILKEVKSRLGKEQEYQAIWLGIEALMREKQNREGTFSILLPGETEE